MGITDAWGLSPTDIALEQTQNTHIERAPVIMSPSNQDSHANAERAVFSPGKLPRCGSQRYAAAGINF